MSHTKIQSGVVQSIIDIAHSLAAKTADEFWNRFKTGTKSCCPIKSLHRDMHEFSVFDRNVHLLQLGHEMEPMDCA